MPTVTIDGIRCEAQSGDTILQVARRHGVWIPTLCYHPALEPSASCRICMVEIDRGGWWQMVTSCNYPVLGDLVVGVNTPRAIQARQGVMELLLARAPESPELQALAARMRVTGTRYPTVTQAHRNCILCGLCVRVCEERIGAAAITMAGRGVERVVSTPFGTSSKDCIGCGACAAVCPVGTIVVHWYPDEVEIEPLNTRVKARGCVRCGGPLGTELVKQALGRRGGPTVREMIDEQSLCQRCKREKLATDLTAVLVR